MSFCNSVIIPLRPGKPHVVFIEGWWRVSKYNKPRALSTSKLFDKAHGFVLKLNNELHCLTERDVCQILIQKQ
jgi:hypothetical protein